MTVLFADVAGSTGLGERLDPERLREILDSFFGAMRGEIEAEGGTVEKFIGDAVFAVFGVPTAHEDDPARALRGGPADATRSRTSEPLARGCARGSTGMRIGVNTGEVVVRAWVGGGLRHG